MRRSSWWNAAVSLVNGCRQELSGAQPVSDEASGLFDADAPRISVTGTIFAFTADEWSQA
jgi:hypothetical protein